MFRTETTRNQKKLLTNAKANLPTTQRRTMESFKDAVLPAAAN